MGHDETTYQFLNGHAAFVADAHGRDPSRLAFEACLERISRRGPQVLEGLLELSKTPDSSDRRFDVAVLEEYFPSHFDGNPEGEGVYAHELRWKMRLLSHSPPARRWAS